MMKFFKKEPEKIVLFVCIENAGRSEQYLDRILMVRKQYCYFHNCISPF